jgi:hypothetical protein
VICRWIDQVPTHIAFVFGFSSAEIGRDLDARHVEGKIDIVPHRQAWNGVDSPLDELRPWKRKLKVIVSVFDLKPNDKAERAKLFRGYSGGPVCHGINGKVIGMIESLDENFAYTIPIDIILSRYHLGIPKGGEIAQPTYVLPFGALLMIKISNCPHYDESDGTHSKNSEKKYEITRRNTLF